MFAISYYEIKPHNDSVYAAFQYFKYSLVFELLIFKEQYLVVCASLPQVVLS